MKKSTLLKLRRTFRALPTLIFLFLSLATWAISSPVGSSPDDNYHLTSIWCAETFFNPECSNSGSSFTVPSGLVAEQCYAFKPSVSGACITDALSKGEYDNVEHINNIEKGYPDLFYQFHAIFKSDNLQVFNLKVRLANTLIFITSIGLLLYLFQDLIKWRKIIFLLTTLFIPLGFFLIPSTNPSSWALIFLPSYWLILRHLFMSEKNDAGKTFYLILILFWIGLNFSRADGSIYSLIATFAIVPLIFKNREILKEKYIYLIGLLSFLSVWNLFRLRTTSEVISGHMNPNRDVGSVDSLQLFISNIKQIYFFFLGGTGRTGLGWLDTYVPNYVWKIMSLVILSIFILSIYELVRTRKFSALTSTFIALSAYLLIPIFILQSSHVQIGGMLQPRYMLPLLSLVLLIPIMEIEISPIDELRYMYTLSPLLLLTFSASLGTNIQRYSTNMNSPFSLDSYNNSKWSTFGWDPLTLWLFGSAVFAIFLWSLLNLIRLESTRSSKMLTSEI